MQSGAGVDARSVVELQALQSASQAVSSMAAQKVPRPYSLDSQQAAGC